MNKLLQLLMLSLLMTVSVNCLASDDKDYGNKVGDKALSGFANMTTAVLEIPKSVINVTNNSEGAYGAIGGVIGGTIKGMINMVGRMLVGVTDFISAPLPTKPYISPKYVWDDFDANTTYGDAFRLEEE